MTAKSLVLHIGDPKTGTSSIQEVLRFEAYTAPGLTVDYPDQLNAFPLANALWDAKQAHHRTERYTHLAEWLAASQADVAIVSAEQFFRVDPAVLQATLDEFLPDYAHNVRVVAYVRPHVNRLLSAYMQRTKAGLFQGDMQTFFERTKRENLLTYTPRFEAWRAQFGSRFTLRPMIRDQLRGGDVVVDFLDLAFEGLPFELKGATEANTSLTLESLVAFREVQAILKRNQVAIGTRHSVGDALSRAVMAATAGKGTRLHLTKPLHDEVAAFCEADAAALDAAFFDEPLMATALRNAAKDAVTIQGSLLAADHYSEETLQTLRQKARQLVALFKKRPQAWTTHFERQIGQRPRADSALPVPPPLRAHLARVDKTLADVAGLIAGKVSALAA